MFIKLFRKTMPRAFLDEFCRQYPITTGAPLGIIVCTEGTNKNHDPK